MPKIISEGTGSSQAKLYPYSTTFTCSWCGCAFKLVGPGEDTPPDPWVRVYTHDDGQREREYAVTPCPKCAAAVADQNVNDTPWAKPSTAPWGAVVAEPPSAIAVTQAGLHKRRQRSVIGAGFIPAAEPTPDATDQWPTWTADATIDFASAPTVDGRPPTVSDAPPFIQPPPRHDLNAAAGVNDSFPEPDAEPTNHDEPEYRPPAKPARLEGDHYVAFEDVNPRRRNRGDGITVKDA